MEIDEMIQRLEFLYRRKALVLDKIAKYDSAFNTLSSYRKSTDGNISIEYQIEVSYFTDPGSNERIKLPEFELEPGVNDFICEKLKEAVGRLREDHDKLYNSIGELRSKMYTEPFVEGETDSELDGFILGK